MCTPLISSCAALQCCEVKTHNLQGWGQTQGCKWACLLLSVVPLDLALVRQLGVAPGSHAARQVDHLLAARLCQLLGGIPAPPPVRAGADKGAVGAHLGLHLQHRGRGGARGRGGHAVEGRKLWGRLAAGSSICPLPMHTACEQAGWAVRLGHSTVSGLSQTAAQLSLLVPGQRTRGWAPCRRSRHPTSLGC